MNDSNRKNEWIASLKQAEEKLREFIENGLTDGGSRKLITKMDRVTWARIRLENDDPHWREGLFDD